MESAPKGIPTAELEGKGRATWVDEHGVKHHDEERTETIFMNIARVTLSDIDQQRDKGRALVAVHNPELIFKGKRPEEMPTARQFLVELQKRITPPELKRNEQLRVTKEGAGKRGSGIA